MELEGLYRRTKTEDSGCDSYYCSTCGGQAGRVEKVLKRTSIDDLYNYLMDIEISEYLQLDAMFKFTDYNAYLGRSDERH